MDNGTTEALGFRGYFLKGIDILRLKGDTAAEVSKDAKAGLAGFMVLLIGGIIVSAGSIIESDFIPAGTATFIIFLIEIAICLMAFFLFIGIIHLLAKAMGGQARFREFYRPTALSFIYIWAHIIPIFGAVLGLWSIVVNVKILEKVHKLTRVRAGMIIALNLLVVLVMLYFMDF